MTQYLPPCTDLGFSQNNGISFSYAGPVRDYSSNQVWQIISHLLHILPCFCFTPIWVFPRI